jgi:hypothetical protein
LFQSPLPPAAIAPTMSGRSAAFEAEAMLPAALLRPPIGPWHVGNACLSAATTASSLPGNGR